MASAEHVFDRLLEIALLIQEDLAASFAGTGLTTARTHLLWVLHHAGPANQQTLAAALSVSPRNVTGLVDALETGGFVERRPHPSDRRATLVTLTERGTETMAAMARDRQAVAARLVEGFGDERVERLGGDLDAIAERLQQMVEAARSTAESA
jgi:DNA-binding MarR family transcriptional regulator